MLIMKRRAGGTYRSKSIEISSETIKRLEKWAEILDGFIKLDEPNVPKELSQ